MPKKTKTIKGWAVICDDNHLIFCPTKKSALSEKNRQFAGGYYSIIRKVEIKILE